MSEIGKVFGSVCWVLYCATRAAVRCLVCYSFTLSLDPLVQPYSFCNHEVHEIFVPHGGAMRSTVAVSNAVVVNVLFELNEDGTSKWKPTSSLEGQIPVPAVYQRRIDIVYHNRYTARMSVRSIVP